MKTTIVGFYWHKRQPTAKTPIMHVHIDGPKNMSVQMTDDMALLIEELTKKIEEKLNAS